MRDVHPPYFFDRVVYTRITSMAEVAKATPYGAIASTVGDTVSNVAQSLGGPGNVAYGPNGEVIAFSYEAAPESHTSMVKYLIIGIVVIAVMLIFWLMSQGPVKPYEFKSFMGFTPARGPATMQTHQRMYGVIPSLVPL